MQCRRPLLVPCSFNKWPRRPVKLPGDSGERTPPLWASAGCRNRFPPRREPAPQVGFLEGVTLCGDADHSALRAGGPGSAPSSWASLPLSPLILQPPPPKLPLPCGPRMEEAGRMGLGDPQRPFRPRPTTQGQKESYTGKERLYWWLL